MDPASRGLRAERLRTLTQHLHDRMETDADEVDSLAMRLLLDEYAAAVADLRATLRDEAAQVATAAAVVNDVRKLIGHRREQQEKRLSSVAPSDPPPAS